MFNFRTIVVGTILMAVVLLAGPWLAVQLENSFPVVTFGGYRYFGILLIAVGVVFAFYCSILLFLPSKRRARPYDADGVFVIAGPYRFVRNPFMLGVILALWGEALLLSSMALIAYAALVSWSIHFWVIFYEEGALMERFGNEYRRYRDSVPRWLPKLVRFEE